jgi:hypothetical protein
LTDVAPVNRVPPMPTLAPAAPLAGLNPLISGGGMPTVKLVELVTVPFGVVTDTGPLVAPGGTSNVSWVSESTLYAAAVPSRVTAVAPVKLCPIRITLDPTGPIRGVKPSIVGAAAVTVNVPEPALPCGVTTVTGPLVAPVGTFAVICPSEVTVKSALVPLNWTAVAPVR